MKAIKVDEGFVVMEDGSFTGRRLYESPEAALIHLTIHPGRAIEPHVAPVDMEFYVLGGRGVFSVGDESIEAGPDTLVESPRGIPHGIANPGPPPLRLLAVKNAPRG
jgi:mannose-6-phosphate isomerase-like protein (cupin superfamily)